MRGNAIRAVRNYVGRILARIFYRPLTFKSFDVAFRDDLERWSPDLIHAHDLVTLPVAMRAAQTLSIPVIFDSHELEEHRNPPLSLLERYIVRRIEKRYLKRCAAVTTVSEPIADYLAQMHTIPRPSLIYNTAPIQRRFSHPRWSPYEHSDLRIDTALGNKAFILVYVGNLAINRGIEVVVSALSQVPSSIYLVTVGRVSPNMREIVNQLAEELGIAGRVRMVPPVAPNEVVEYITQANAAIIPVLPATLSYEFAMPNKLFESAFAGLPIVASDILEVGRFVRRHKLGLLYDPFDVHDCAEKIYELYSNYARYKPSAEKVEALKKEYAWEVQEQKLGQIVSEVLGRLPAQLPAGASGSKSIP